ncbi:hypothetical protein IWQ62_004874 [Dispira parvispora]|uniref:O-methyltransferase n=1 Tax=Dispira parvispora TaxID=1520584 RepID=A0A9W8E580_9FUNG|nr:hypothetical protein IWQ62_004874 [Dispira parvispora]
MPIPTFSRMLPTARLSITQALRLETHFLRGMPRQFSIATPLHRTALSLANLTAGEPVTNTNLASTLLTEGYCCDHSFPHTGTADLVLTEDQPATSSAPYPANVDHSLAYLEEIRSQSFKKFPGLANMMISRNTGQCLYWLVTLLKPRNILELGSLTGYSALWLAEGMKRLHKNPVGDVATEPPVTACELKPQLVETIRANLRQYGMEPWIQVKEGPAMDTLRAFPTGTQYDLIFMDANKSDYINYYETIISSGLLAPEGLLVVDNTLFRNQVCVKYPAVQKILRKVNKVAPLPGLSGEDTGKRTSKTPEYIMKFNQYVAEDPRTENIMLPLFDGMSLIRHRSL